MAATIGLLGLLPIASAQEVDFRFSDPTAMRPRTIMRASDGALYGTARGGPADKGTIYRVKPEGPVETLYSFRGPDGERPLGGLIEGSDGYLYGTTSQGGSDNYGTVFRMSKDGQLTTLVSLNSELGGFPLGRLIEGPDGAFLGVAGNGGAALKGTIFKVTKSGEATVVVNFYGSNGYSPGSALVRGDDGNYYGTTDEGGPGRGTIFRLTPDGTLTTLKYLQDADGLWPSELLLAQDGNFYGTTMSRGALGGGTFFKVSRDGNYTVLASFSSPEVASFSGQLVQDADGTIYGALDGAVFKYTASAGIEIVHGPSPLINFDYWGGLVADGTGAFLATTSQGEGPGLGRILEFKPSRGFTTRALFGEKGAGIGESLAWGDDGEIYGTTALGVAGYGSIFRISPTGEFSTVHAFSGADGNGARAGLVRAKNGSFYGTTSWGSEHGYGTIFKFTPGAGATTIYSFESSGDAWLTSAVNGSVHGVTQYGGAFGYGTIFKIGEDDTVTRIAELDGSICRYPDAPLFEAADGSLYGTAVSDTRERMVFRLGPNGEVTRFASFGGVSYYTQCRMIRSVDGAIYGYDESGSFKAGRIFKLAATGEITTVAVFSQETGAYPRAGLIEAPDGFLYGTTGSGGAHGYGTIFRASRDGQIVALHSFDGKSAARPQTSPILGSDGDIYGAAEHLAFWRLHFNDPPSAVPDEVSTRAGAELIIDVLANDTDPDNDDLAVTALSQGTQGGFVSTAEGRIRYVAKPAFTGVDTFEYTIGDGSTGSATGTVTVNVAPAEMLSLNTPVHKAGHDSSSAPSGAVWSYFGSPAINVAGTVAMFARWRAPSERFGGIVGVAANGDVTVYARIGDPVPGLPGARFANFMDPLIASDGSVAFRASIAGTGVTRERREVICWSDADRNLALVARAGDPVPLLRGAPIARFASLALASGGEVLFRATLSKRNGVNEFNDDALFAWSAPSSSSVALIREGQQLPGLGRVRRFTTLVDSKFAPGADRGWFGRGREGEPASARMRVEFANASPRLMDWQPRTGVVRAFMNETSDSNTQVKGTARNHNVFPLGLPFFSSFAADTFFCGVTPAGAMALYRQEQAAGKPYAVFSVGQSVPELPDARIATISDPAGAPDGTSVAWLSRVLQPASASPVSNALLWLDGSDFRIIAKTGAQAADCKPGTLWKRFTSFAIPRNAGGPVFIAEVRPAATRGSTASATGADMGLWAVDATAQPRLFLRKGESVGGVKLDAFRLFGRSRGAAGVARAISGGKAVVQIVGSDGSRHLLPVSLP